MSIHRCCLCYETISHDGPKVVKLSLHEAETRVIIRWCLGCFDKDPLAVEMANGDAEDDDVRFSTAYLAMCDRIFSARGGDVLRQCVDVRRDLESPTLTLRGPGSLWGRRSTKK